MNYNLDEEEKDLLSSFSLIHKYITGRLVDREKILV